MITTALTLLFSLSSFAAAPLSCRDFTLDQYGAMANVKVLKHESFKQLARQGAVTERHRVLAMQSQGWEYYRDSFFDLPFTPDLQSAAGFNAALLGVFGTSLDDVEYDLIQVDGRVLERVTTFHGDADFSFGTLYVPGTTEGLPVRLTDETCQD